jgi:uncharacterized protein YukE
MSSEHADVTPEELRKFAAQLNAFKEKLSTDAKVLHAHFKALGSTWRDREHEHFAQEFEQTMQVIAKFVESSEKHIPFLLRKAQKAEDYLTQR